MASRPALFCELCSTHINDTRYRRNLSTSKLATAALNGLVATVCTGLSVVSREQLVPSGYACRKCYTSLEKLKKSQTTVDELTATFFQHLRDRAVALQSQTQSTTTRKRSSAHFDSPVSSSTPNWRSPARKRPLVTTSPLRGTVNRVRHARKSLSFTTHPVQQPSPQVNVVETSRGERDTVKKKFVVTSSNLKRATMHLAKGNYCSFAITAMKIPRLKKEVIKVVAAEVRCECQALCSTLPGKKSVLRRTSAADLKTFQFSKVVAELCERAPAFSAILEASVKRHRKQHTRDAIIPLIGFAAAVLLHERNNLMCAAQSVNSILFHQGHASKMDTNDSHLLQQPSIADDPEIDDVITSFQDLSVDQLEDSYCLEEDMEDVQPAQSTTNCDDIPQLFLSGTFYTYPYKIIGDNIDMKVKPRDMRVDKQSKMLNYFHIFALKGRVFNGPQAPQKGPSYGEFLCLALEDILPMLSDKDHLQENYIVLFARVICEQLPFFKKNFSECVPLHIDHCYSEQMSQKSDVCGKTALHLASSKGHTDVVKVLLDSGALIDKKDEDGWTAFHYAFDRGRTDVVTLLVASGAQIDNKDKIGRTALDLASHMNHTDVVKAIASGAQQGIENALLQVKEAQKKAQEAEERAVAREMAADVRVQEAQKQAQEAEEKVREEGERAKMRVQEAQEQAQEAQQRVIDMEMVALEQLEKDTEAKVQEAQEQADQEQRAIELVKKNTELERCVREMEERFRESEGRQNVEFEDDPSSDSVKLSSGDLQTVLNLTWEARSRWYNIGLNLGIPVSTLDAVRRNHRDICEDCYTTVLSEWLRDHPSPTWSAVDDALRAPSVKMNHITKHLPFSKICESSSPVEGEESQSSNTTAQEQAQDAGQQAIARETAAEVEVHEAQSQAQKAVERERAERSVQKAQMQAQEAEERVKEERKIAERSSESHLSETEELGSQSNRDQESQSSNRTQCCSHCVII